MTQANDPASWNASTVLSGADEQSRKRFSDDAQTVLAGGSGPAPRPSRGNSALFALLAAVALAIAIVVVAALLVTRPHQQQQAAPAPATVVVHDQGQAAPVPGNQATGAPVSSAAGAAAPSAPGLVVSLAGTPQPYQDDHYAAGPTEVKAYVSPTRQTYVAAHVKTCAVSMAALFERRDWSLVDSAGTKVAPSNDSFSDLGPSYQPPAGGISGGTCTEGWLTFPYSGVKPSALKFTETGSQSMSWPVIAN